MSNTPQVQNPQAQNASPSGQNQSKTLQAGNNIKKDEDRMKNEGGNSSASANKPSNYGTK